MNYQDFPRLSSLINVFLKSNYKILGTYNNDNFCHVYLREPVPEPITITTPVVVVLRYEKKYDLLDHYLFGFSDLKEVVKDDEFRELMKQIIEDQEKNK